MKIKFLQVRQNKRFVNIMCKLESLALVQTFKREIAH